MYSFVPRSDPERLDGSDAQLALFVTYLDGWIDVAFTTLLVYNSVINFDKEVKYFWVKSKPLNSVSLVYFTVRFLGLLAVASALYYDGTSVTSDGCQSPSDTYDYVALIVILGTISEWIDSFAESAIIVLIDYILTIRVLALYHNDRKMCIVLNTLLGLEAVVGLGVLIPFSIGYRQAAFGISGVGTVCAVVDDGPSGLLLAGTIIPLLYGLLLIVLALCKAVAYWKLSSGLKDFLFVGILVRDQIIYYGSILFVCSLKVADIAIANSMPLVSQILEKASSNILLCVLGGQLLISLKEAGEKGVNDDTGRTLTAFEFEDSQVRSDLILGNDQTPTSRTSC